MSAKRVKQVRSGDVDALERLIDSRGWQLVSRRLQRELDRKMAELMQAQPEIHTAQLRGGIESLKLALEMPKRLMKEGQKHGVADEA